ncbi:uracil-DNA glycosylase [Hoeflea sp. G2-23]|uniref:Type-5 uracil-DNA glycosylase n=1 Tax=Hoeflea algicola TaxID=2983763 RepID=A0ABT3Z8N5_9HYPH|nr:uracil-DNA glycosylase [Hoeflea algicola]MCY0147636.1 uracil-DNA glycosylase [Hoeflea algicola]
MARTLTEPDHDCGLCPRLRGFILDNRKHHPDWHNGPVRTFYPPEGPHAVRLLVIGLAPGLRGANRTGRPFTGDDSGDLLYATLGAHGLAGGSFEMGADDGLRLDKTAITNAVRCVPPENKPVGAEINTCRAFLSATISHLENLRAIVTLGKIAHDSTVRALGGKISAHPFGHNAQTVVAGIQLFSSYHCSRYNINTGRLTPEMFNAVFADVARFLSRDQALG